MYIRWALDEFNKESAAPQPPAQEVHISSTADLDWAVDHWRAQVSRRPLHNVHRRTLDDVWRQLIRHFGGDDVVLCGPRHDDLLTDIAGEGP